MFTSPVSSPVTAEYCHHEIVRTGPSSYSCTKCRRTGFWRDGFVQWFPEAQDAPASASPQQPPLVLLGGQGEPLQPLDADQCMVPMKQLLIFLAVAGVAIGLIALFGMGG